MQDGAVKPGDHAELVRSFTAADLEDYAAVSGHRPGADRVPEPLIGALFSCLLGIRLPGLGTMYLKQETRWHSDAAVGEPLTARVEITRIRPEKYLVDLATTCRGVDGGLIADGRALVYVREVVAGTAKDD